jgi:hypothetical protein
VATALVLDLILDMQSCGSGANHFLYRTADGQNATPTCIHINQNRNISYGSDASRILKMFVERGDAKIG